VIILWRWEQTNFPVYERIHSLGKNISFSEEHGLNSTLYRELYDNFGNSLGVVSRVRKWSSTTRNIILRYIGETGKNDETPAPIHYI
jgi:hypothetical protein